MKTQTDNSLRPANERTLANASSCRLCGVNAGEQCRDANGFCMGSLVHSYGERFRDKTWTCSGCDREYDATVADCVCHSLCLACCAEICDPRGDD